MSVPDSHSDRQHPHRHPTALVTAAALVIVAQLADGATTYMGLQAGLAEANPLAAVVIGTFGPGLGVALATSGSLLWLIGLALALDRAVGWYAPHHRRPAVTMYLLLFAVLTTLTVAWNVTQIAGTIHG